MDDEADPPPAMATVLKDWITLWQSEMAALTVDREMAENAQAMVDAWAGAAGAMAGAMVGQIEPAGSRGERPAGRARPTAPAGAPPLAAAPDARDAEIRELRARVAELEQRIAALEQRPGRRNPRP